MSWDDVTSGRGMRLQSEFMNAFVLHQAPTGAAMFSSRSREANEYFFNPEAAAIFELSLASWGAQECEAPSPDDLIVLVGEARA